MNGGRPRTLIGSYGTIETKYEQHGKTVEFIGMNDYTTAFHARLTGGLGNGH